jgi:hypothetical protein
LSKGLSIGDINKPKAKTDRVPPVAFFKYHSFSDGDSDGISGGANFRAFGVGLTKNTPPTFFKKECYFYNKQTFK